MIGTNHRRARFQNMLKGHSADNPKARKIECLTSPEREVINLVCRGFRNKSIADMLHISEATVSHQLTSIYHKLEVEMEHHWSFTRRSATSSGSNLIEAYPTKTKSST